MFCSQYVQRGSSQHGPQKSQAGSGGQSLRPGRCVISELKSVTSARYYEGIFSAIQSVTGRHRLSRLVVMYKLMKKHMWKSSHLDSDGDARAKGLPEGRAQMSVNSGAFASSRWAAYRYVTFSWEFKGNTTQCEFGVAIT